MRADRRLWITPLTTAMRGVVGHGTIAAGLALSLMAGCGPSSGIAPPQLLTAGEIAALDRAQAGPAAPGAETIDSLAEGLAAAPPHADSADPRPRGEALRARAAALRAREAGQITEADTLRRRAEALRAASAARAREAAQEEVEEERRSPTD